MIPVYGTNVFGANVIDCNCRCHHHQYQSNQVAAPSFIGEEFDTIDRKKESYEELQLAFKAIHDEYVASDAFGKWAAAKKAWEETETYKTDSERYLGNIIKNQQSSEDYNLYLKFCYLSNSLSKGSWNGNFNMQCPGLSKPQEKFDLKRKLLLLEYGLPSDTKLPSEWYLGGYEWDWS